MRDEMKETTKKMSRRYIIAMIYFIIAIILAVIECIIMKKLNSLDFFNIVASAVLYPIYYTLISTVIEDYKIWPLAVLAVLCFLFFGIVYTIGGTINIFFELLEIILFVSQIITAIIIKVKCTQRE